MNRQADFVKLLQRAVNHADGVAPASWKPPTAAAPHRRDPRTWSGPAVKLTLPRNHAPDWLSPDIISMGLMRFIAPSDRLTEETVRQAYLSGYDRVPWQTKTRWTNGELQLERNVSESGTLNVQWPVKSHGMLTLSTSTLMERPQPYHLPLELARGKICQVRGQLAEWQGLGLKVKREIEEELARAVGYLSLAAVVEHGSQRSVDLAEQAICSALDTGNLLAKCYAEQALAARRRGSEKLSLALGADLGTSPLDDVASRWFLETFNAAKVPLRWRDIETSEGTFQWDLTDRQVEWCSANRLKVCGGPLLQLDEKSLPDWLALYEDDCDVILSCASDFITAAVKRYRGRIDLWQSAGRANTANVLSLDEEERIRLVARAVELTHELDPKTPALVSFDQPWAEYVSRQPVDFPPVHFADDLIRSDLGLAGLMLEVNMGYYPGGTLPRDPLEFGRLLDHWSQLGLPLYLALTLPSNRGADPLARQPARLVRQSWTARVQQAWVGRYVPLLFAKPCVAGIFWNQLRDAQEHDFAHGGLFDPKGHPKPALRQLASFRHAYLD